MSAVVTTLSMMSPWVYVAALAAIVGYLLYAYVLDGSSRRALRLYSNAKSRVRDLLQKDQRCIVHGSEVVSNESIGQLGRKFTIDDATDVAMQEMIDNIAVESAPRQGQPQPQPSGESPVQSAYGGGAPRQYEAPPPQQAPRQQQAPVGLAPPPSDDLQSVYGASIAGRLPEGMSDAGGATGNVKSRGNISGGVYSATV